MRQTHRARDETGLDLTNEIADGIERVRPVGRDACPVGSTTSTEWEIRYSSQDSTASRVVVSYLDLEFALTIGTGNPLIDDIRTTNGLLYRLLVTRSRPEQLQHEWQVNGRDAEEAELSLVDALRYWTRLSQSWC